MKSAGIKKIYSVLDLASYFMCGFFVNFFFWVSQNSDSIERDELIPASFEYWRGFVFAIPYIVSYMVVWFSVSNGKKMSFDRLAIVSIIGTLVWIIGFSIGFFLKFGKISDSSSSGLEIVMFLIVCILTFVSSLLFRAIAIFFEFVTRYFSK